LNTGKNRRSNKVREYNRFVTAGIVSFLTILGLIFFFDLTLAQSIETGVLLFTAIVLIFYTNETQKMKQEILNQTAALVAPSVCINNNLSVNEATFSVFNYSSENIARDFHGQLYYHGKKVDEKTIPVVGFTGAESLTAMPQKMVFPISKEHFNNREILSLKYYFSERTGNFKFEGEFESLVKTAVWSMPHLKM